MNFKSLLTFAFAAAALSASAEVPYTYSVGDIITNGGKTYRVVSENIVTNPYFENGLANWTSGTHVTLTDEFYEITTDASLNNANVLRAKKGQSAGSGSNQAVVSSTQLTPGKTYYVSLYAATKSTNCRVRYSTTKDDINGGTPIVNTGDFTTSGPSWKYLEKIFNSDATNDSYVIFQYAWLSQGDRFAWHNVVEVEEVSSLDAAKGMAAKYTKENYPYALDNKFTALTEACNGTDEAAIINAYRAVVESNSIAENVEGRVDFTSSIKNPLALGDKADWNAGSFDVIANENPTYANQPAELKYFDKYNAGSLTAWQEVALPAGEYQLAVTARSAYATGTFKLIAGDNEIELSKLGNVGQTFGIGWNDHIIRFKSLGESTPVKIQIVTNTSNGKWASFTNFRLTQVAKASDEEKFQAALEAAQTTLNNADYEKVTGEERTTLANAIETATAQDYSNLAPAIEAFIAAKPAYDAYAAKVVEVNSFLENCKDASTAKLDALRALIIEAASATEAETATGSFVNAIRDVVASNAIAEGMELHEDFTSYIINPIPANTATRWTKENEILDGWYMEQANGNANMRIMSNESPVLSDGSTPIYYDTDNWNDGDWTSKFSQKITLPAGRYRLAVTARGSNNLGWYRLASNEETIDMAHHESNDGVYGRGWEDNYIDFETLGGEVIISIHGRGNGTGRWESFTNFRLTRIERPETINTDALELIIGTAQNLVDTTVGDDTEGNYPSNLRNELESALADAQSVHTAAAGRPYEDSLQESVNQATANLKTAVDAYTPAKILVVAGKWYYIKNVNGELYWHVDAESNQLKLSGINPEVTTYAANAATVNDNHKFRFTAVEGEANKYTIDNGEMDENSNHYAIDCTHDWNIFSTKHADYSTAHVVSVEEADGNLIIATNKTKENRACYMAPDAPIAANGGIFSDKTRANALERGAISLVAVPENQTPTGIEAVAADAVEGDNVVYDLYGRRVENPSNGIYIVNGKKVVIR